MRFRLLIFVCACLVCGAAILAQDSQTDVGVPVTDAATKAACSGCHKIDDKGRMTRISYIRTTPEGWQTIIKRMVRNNNLQIDPVKARAIVKYLSNNHGLTPAEARVGFYEVERRSVVERVPNEIDQTCRRCH